MNAFRGRVCILIVVSGACSAYAQSAPPAMIGPGAGIAWIAERARLAVYQGSFDCGAFEHGDGMRYSVDVNVLLPSLFSERLGAAVAVGVDRFVGALTAVPAEPTRFVDVASGHLVDLDHEYRLDRREVAASVWLSAEYTLATDWRVGAGALARYTFAGRYEQSDNIRGPGGYTFSNGSLRRALQPASAMPGSWMSFEPTVTVSHTISMSDRVTLQPQVVAGWALTAPPGIAPWRRLGIGGRIIVLFHAPPQAVPAQSIPAEKPGITAPLTPGILAASIAVTGLGRDLHPIPVARVDVRELVVRQVAPLLRAVFFDRDSPVLPARYSKLTPAEASAFAIDSLRIVELYELQHQTLDIAGARLQRHPTAMLTLAGITSDGESPTLQHLRAEHVRDYLEHTWGIARERIAMQYGVGFLALSSRSTDDGQTDNRRVEMASNNDTVLAPVVTERVTREFNPPMIRFDPTIAASAGVRRWSIAVTQGGREVARYEGDGTKAAGSVKLTLVIDEQTIDSVLSPLRATLVVEDSTGATTHTTAEVPLTVAHHVQRVDGRVQRVGDRERISCTLVGFDFDSDRLSAADRDALAQIAAIVHKGARATVTGYTDRIGDPARNRELSAARASVTATVMRNELAAHNCLGCDVVEIGAGVETLRFTNDTPEGRMLSRGVSIVVEQDATDDGLSIHER